MKEQDAPQEAGIEEGSLEKSSERRRRRGERRYRFAPRERQRLPTLRWWREALLAGCLLAAVLFLINPFARWARSQAVVASPAAPLAVTPPPQPAAGYCLAGDFQGWDGRSTPLLDDGSEGDRTAGDGIYSRRMTFTEPRRYLWRVLPCGQWETAVPEKSAWLFVTAPNQTITFTFNPRMPAGDLWPKSYAFTANDTLPARPVVVGSFQNRRWDSGDTRTVMEPIGNDQYQLAYRIPLPNTYEAYVAIQGRSEGIGASGRSMEPVPLAFTTEFPAEMVVIQYDGRTDRITVLSGLPWLLSWLGFSWGGELIALISLFGAGILLVQIGYKRVVLRPNLHYTAGCPNCQEPYLQRVNRENRDYLLNLMGIPVRRYKCNQCGWQGRRIYHHHPR